MTLEIALVLGILAVSLVLFISEVIRMDVVALLVLLALVLKGFYRKSDLPILGRNVDHDCLQGLADAVMLGRTLDLVLRDLRDVYESLDTFLELDEDAEIGDVGDLAFHDGAGRSLLLTTSALSTGSRTDASNSTLSSPSEISTFGTVTVSAE